MVNLDSLIHDRTFFTQDHIRERQAQYNFTQRIKVETFLWDLELYGQLQRVLNDKIILKGGTAAQLYIPSQRQRTSVDIDVIYLGDLSTLAGALSSIHRVFGEDDLLFKFAKYIPKSPKTVLPMETYFVAVPSAFGGPPINIKVDFHFMDQFDLQITQIENASAFVIPLAFQPRCLSCASLLGDKLLTLAQGSVGISIEREDEIPKQLHDLDFLSRVVVSEDTQHVMNSMNILFAREIAAREQDIAIEHALDDMVVLLEKYADIDDRKGDSSAKRAINNFKGNYEPRPFRNPLAWEIICKRLQFLVRAIAEEPKNFIQLLNRADTILDAIDLTGNPRRADIRLQLVNYCVDVLISRGHSSVAKRLRNTLPERIIWEILQPSDLGEIEAFIVKITS